MPMQQSAPRVAAENDNTRAKKPRRSERRAQQNRVAQRRYRDKLKQRQERLEEFARRHGYDPDGPDPVLGDEGMAGSPSLTLDPPLERDAHGPKRIHCPILTGYDDCYTAASDSVRSSDDSAAQSSNLRGLSDAGATWPDFMNKSPVELVTFLDEELLPHDLAIDKDKILAEYDLRALTTTNHLLSSNKRLLLEHLFHILGLNGRETNSSLVKMAFSAGLNLRQLLISGIKNVVHNDENFNRQIAFGGGGTTNLFANTLRFQRFATLNALLSNALALGIHIPDLYNPRKISPFWRPEIKTVADICGPVAAEFLRLPLHLRPTSLQILRPHNTCFDLLPFPALRMRIIGALSMEPPMFDEWDLKHDMIHDGITCTTTGRGQPWDMRSWEIAPWFKEKWGRFLFRKEVPAAAER